MHIEFLYWDECPSHEAALARLHEVLREEGVSPTIDVIHVSTEEQAASWRFPGSPTIRIDGADIATPPTGTGQFDLTCRIYLMDDGRVSPLPSKETIRRGIRESTQRSRQSGELESPGKR